MRWPGSVGPGQGRALTSHEPDLAIGASFRVSTRVVVGFAKALIPQPEVMQIASTRTKVSKRADKIEVDNAVTI
jgi:hypothetical protein